MVNTAVSRESNEIIVPSRSRRTFGDFHPRSSGVGIPKLRVADGTGGVGGRGAEDEGFKIIVELGRLGRREDSAPRNMANLARMRLGDGRTRSLRAKTLVPPERILPPQDPLSNLAPSLTP